MKWIFLMIFFFTSFASAQSISSVYFDHDSWNLTETSQAKLDSLTQLQKQLVFRIVGYCDDSGTDLHNKVLSEKRASKVKEYLTQKLPKNIVIGSTLGLGEEKQINDNSTEDLRAKNRRVDIFIDTNWTAGETISKENYRDFFITKIIDMKVKDTFLLKDVNFYGGRSVWLLKSENQLKKLYFILKENQNMTVELQGHICCDYENFDGEDIDTGTFNLSWNRANAIKKFLQQKGIDSTRTKVKGLGHLNPLVYPEKTENDRTKNRRVEILLLAK